MSQTSEVKFSRNIAALIYIKKIDLFSVYAQWKQFILLQKQVVEIIPTYCVLHLGFGFKVFK